MRVPALAVLSLIVLAGCASPAEPIDTASAPDAATDVSTPLDTYVDKRVVALSWSPVGAPDVSECTDSIGVGLHYDPDDPTAAGGGGPGAGFRYLRAREGAQRLVVTLESTDPAAKWNLCVTDIAEFADVSGASPLTIEVALAPGDKPTLQYGVEPDPTHPVVQATLTINVTWWADAPAN